MRRTGKGDDDNTLLAVYINGLDKKLQEMMHVARATHLTMWNANGETPKVSIPWEIQDAIALEISFYHLIYVSVFRVRIYTQCMPGAYIAIFHIFFEGGGYAYIRPHRLKAYICPPNHDTCESRFNP